MYVSLYHKTLRVSAVVVALMLVFDSGLFSPVTKQFSDDALVYLTGTAIGMTASIKETKVNQMSAELRSWQDSLEAREAKLDARTISARDFGGGSGLPLNLSTYILSAILFILTVLIILNYTLDFARMRRVPYEEKSA